MPQRLQIEHVPDWIMQAMRHRAVDAGQPVRRWLIDRLSDILATAPENPDRTSKPERTYDQGDTQPVAFMPRLELGEPLPLRGHDRDQHEDGTCRIYGCLRCRVINAAREKRKP